MTKGGATGPPIMKRTDYLVDALKEFIPRGDKRFTVLCVGCRNARELDVIEHTCGVRVQGLDLFSEDPRIAVGDMHDMPFEDDAFDALFSCNSLEHAYDLEVALADFVRVTKPDGLLVIEVPTNYEISVTDRWDVKSSHGVLALLGDAVGAVKMQEDADGVARLIVSIKK